MRKMKATPGWLPEGQFRMPAAWEKSFEALLTTSAFRA
jgi:hypothetical protein